MKKNHLFTITVLQMISGVFVVFLFQGCCPFCFSGTVKQKSNSRPNNAEIRNKRMSTVPESIAVLETISARETITAAQPVSNNNNDAAHEVNVFVEPEISNEYNLRSNKFAEAGLTIFPVVKNSEDRKHESVIKSNPALPVEGKPCPLGIRSITSHIIAGPNVSFKSSKEGDDVYGNNKHKHEPGLGFQVGTGSTIAFTEKFSVNTALLLKQNNSSEKITYTYTDPGSPGGGGGGETKDKYSYTYLSAPVVASYKVGKQTEVFAGPEVNYLLRSSVKREGGTGGNDKENITKNSVKLGVGVQAGVKYKIPSGNGDSPFGVQLLYEHRLSRLNKKNPDGYSTYDVPAWNMKGFQLGVTCSICELMKGKN